MLDITPQSLSFQRSPQRELMHGVGLGGPEGELVGVEGEFIFHDLY